jgi:octaprenyl-diphosphate synthase
MLAAGTSSPQFSATPAPTTAQAWQRISQEAEPFLDAVAASLTAQVGEFEPQIAEFVRYALDNQGKQLRPLLVALSAGCFDRPGPDHVRVAVIIEMVHLATLVHDDIMDGAELRRARPTLAAKWGSEISVLVGDCLFAHALKLASGFDTTEVCRAVSTATNTVCTGEILQTQRRRDFTLNRADYFKMLAMKTGELFALACDLGAHVSGATAAQRRALRNYGLALGTAYQIYDDCLDLFSTEGVTGKSIGTDLAKGKLTLPLIYALERASDSEAARLQQQINDWQPDHLPSVLALAAKFGAKQECRRVLSEFLDTARTELQAVPAAPGRLLLQEIADFLGVQTEQVTA